LRIVGYSGNVGIGTTNPTHRLRVEGDVLATSSITASGDISGARYMINGSTVLAILPGSGSFAVGPDISTGNTGDYNLFVGSSAGRSNTSGASNTFMGYNAGRTNSTGLVNTFLGTGAGYKNTTVSSNTFVGAWAGYNNTAGWGNAFFGSYAGYTNSGTSGVANTFVGANAGYTNSNSSDNTYLGYQAGYKGTNSSNTLLGSAAGYNNTATNNTFVGSYVGYGNTTGANNTFLGSNTAYNNSTGGNNTFVGYLTGLANTTGSTNTIVGYKAGYYNQTGSANAIFGNETGYGATGQSFSSSTLVGYQAGYGLTIGSDNILLGFKAGYNITSGTGNIIIGYNKAAPAATTSNHLNIGGIIDGDLVTGKVGIGTTGPKLKAHVSGSSALPSNSGAVANGLLMVEAGSEGINMGLDPASPYGGWIQVQNINTANTYRPLLLQPSGGNVSIGTTTSSGAKLEVQGPVQIGNDNVTEYSLKLQRYSSKRAVAHFYTNTNDNPSLLYGENLVWTGERAGTVDSTLAYKPYYEAFTPTGGYREFGYVNATSGNFIGTALVPSLVLKSDGNVGIGTMTPGYKLDVNGSFNATSVYANGVLLSPGTGSNWSVDGSNIYRSVGNVGIGNTNPGYKLVADGDTNGALIPAVFRNINTGSSAYAEINVVSGASKLRLGVTDDAYAGWTGGSFVYSTDTNGRLALGTASSERVTISSGGYVGIGTTTPQLPLDIYSGTLAIMQVQGPSTLNKGIYLTDSTNNRTWAISHSNNNLFQLAYYNGSSWMSPQPITVDTGGDVGIGTTNPTHRLRVEGDVLATSSITASGDISAARYMINGSTVLAILPGIGNFAVGPDISTGSTGDYNVFVGSSAGRSLTDGNNNAFLGYNAGRSNSRGTSNTFVGFQAGYKDTLASSNTFVGAYAGYNESTGYANAFFGYYAGGTNTTASANSFVGWYAGGSNQTGSSNVFMGYNAGRTNVSGVGNVFLGQSAGYANTASYNVFLGYNAGYNNSSGKENSFLGTQAGVGTTTGGNNTFVGYRAALSNTTGSTNTIVGYMAGYFTQTGSANAIFGNDAGFGATGQSFSSTTLVGYRAGFGLTTGNDNILVGFKAGYNITSGTGNIIIGYDKAAPAATTSNHLSIGGIVDGDLVSGNIGIGTTAPTDKLEVRATVPSQAAISGSITATSGTNYGVYGQATGVGATTNYGGYFYATGATYNYALRAVGDIEMHGSRAAPAYIKAQGEMDDSQLILKAGSSAGYFGAISVSGWDGTGVASHIYMTTAGNERLRIDNSGNVGIGTASPGAVLDVKGGEIRHRYDSAFHSFYNTAGTARTGFLQMTTSASYLVTELNNPMYFRTNNTDRISITAAGNVGIGTTAPGYALTVVGTAWVTSSAWSGSDKRWKKNITPLQSSLSKIMRLNPVDFDWRKDEFPGLNLAEGRQIGFIAQEVESVIPEVVTTNKEGYKGISYEQIVPVLTKAVQEQQAQIDSQQKEIVELKAKISEITGH
ncbi:MAG: hypothetical protein A2270_00465, partial [Elusimicrobia bacterium RIFOXYA12_FULL_51_18]